MLYKQQGKLQGEFILQGFNFTTLHTLLDTAMRCAIQLRHSSHSRKSSFTSHTARAATLCSHCTRTCQLHVILQLPVQMSPLWLRAGHGLRSVDRCCTLVVQSAADVRQKSRFTHTSGLHRLKRLLLSSCRKYTMQFHPCLSSSTLQLCRQNA